MQPNARASARRAGREGRSCDVGILASRLVPVLQWPCSIPVAVATPHRVATAATAIAGTAYTLTDVGSGGANLAQYDRTLTCTDSAGIQTGLPNAVAFSAATGYTLTPVAGAQISCTITNTAKPVKLTLTQQIITPFPVNLMPPFTFNYSINNGWPLQPQPLTTTAFNVPVSTAQRNLAASNTNTTLSTSLPDARWTVSSLRPG